MDVHLNEEELLREENLFAPHEMSYKPLEDRTYDIRSFNETIVVADDMPEPPASC